MGNKKNFEESVNFIRPNLVKICFQLCSSISGNTALNIDLAPHVPGANNWSGKQTFQCSFDEIISLLSLIVLKLEKINFAFHGAENNKSLQVTRKEKSGDIYHCFIIYQGGNPSQYINLNRGEMFRLFTYLLKIVAKQLNFTNEEVVKLIRAVY